MAIRRKQTTTTGKKVNKTKKTHKRQKNANKDENVPRVPTGPSLLILGIDNLRCIHNFLGIDYLSQRRMEKACGLPVMGIRKLPPASIDLVRVKKSHIRVFGSSGISILMKFSERKEYQINVYIKNKWHRGIAFGVDGKCTKWKLKARYFITPPFALSHTYILTESWSIRNYPNGNVHSSSLHQHVALILPDGKYEEKIKQLRKYVDVTAFLKIFHLYQGTYGNGMNMKRIELEKKTTKPKEVK